MRHDSEGDALTSALACEPGETHALALVRNMDPTLGPVARLEVSRKIDEKGHAKPRSRHLKDVDSFTAFVKRYGDPMKSLVLFDTLTAKGGGKAVLCLDEQIERGVREFGVFRPEFSPAWTRWESIIANRGMTQKDLLDLLTDYAADVAGVVREIKADGTILVAPGGSAALRASLANLVFTSEIDVKSVQVGEHDTVISFSRTDKAAESTRVPSEFALSIPVFVGENPRTVVVRLKTNDPTRDSGRLAFSLKCVPWDDVERAAWDEMLGRVKASLPEWHVLRGDFGGEPGDSY